MSRRWFAVLLAAILPWPHVSSAADLSLGIATRDLRLRQNAPVPLPLTLTWPGPDLLEGRLSLTIFSRGKTLGTTQLPPLVLNPGRRALQALLPPIPIPAGEPIAVQVQFISEKRTHELGLHNLGTAQLGGAKELILCAPHTPRITHPTDMPRLASLRPEKFFAHDLQMPHTFLTLTTTPDAAALPERAAGWCAWDAVFLDGPAFAAMTEPQLKSLASWVFAGGSVAVTPGDENARGFEKRHLDFTAELAAESGLKPQFLEGGRIGFNAPGDTQLMRAGLGSAAFVTAPQSVERLAHPAWRDVVMWLWRVDASKLAPAPPEDVLLAGMRPPNALEPAQSEVVWAVRGFELELLGRPGRIPPTPVIAVLAVLLLLAAPGDWMVLGKLRRRRWTWLLFPTLCAAAAWAMSAIANRHLGHGDRTGTMRIVDIGENGRVLRDTRLELLVPSRDREWPLEFRDGAAAALPNPFALSTDAAENIAATTDWRSRDSATLRRGVQQWTPSLACVTTFPRTTDDSGVDWQRLRSAVEAGTPPGVEQPRNWRYIVIRDAFAKHVAADGMLAETDVILEPLPWTIVALARRVDTRTPDLLFRLPPDLSGSAADLATMNAADRTVAIAWKKEGSTLTVLRRHFRK